MKKQQQSKPRKDLKEGGEYYEVIIKRHGKKEGAVNMVAADLETLMMILEASSMLQSAALKLVNLNSK